MLKTTIGFAVAFLVSFTLTPVVRRLAFRMHLLDLPNSRKVHRNPIPLLGGLAIYIGAVASILLLMDGGSRNQVVAILSGGTLLLVLGILDDRKLLHHQVKLMFGMPAAATLLLLSGIRANVFASLWPGVGGAVLDGALAFFWVVGLTSAFSILDHMDGLCSGIAAVSSAFFASFAIAGEQYLVAILAASILGAALAFLWWNFNPAKIFMGDGGAMFLGFMMAALGLKLRAPSLPASTSWMVPVLIVGVAIFDTTLVSFSRLRRGLLPFASPGKDHTAHRLVVLGLSHRLAVLALYAGGLVCGALALLISRLPVVHSYVIFVAATLAAGTVMVRLESAPYDRQEGPRIRFRFAL